MKALVLAVSAACLVFAVAACAGGGAESAGPAPSAPVEAEPATSSADTPTFELWFIGNETGGPCCSVFSTSRTAEELGIPHVGTRFAVGRHLFEKLVEALIAGPSPVEAAYGLASPVHPDTRLLGVSLENGIVTVDLSSEFQCAQGGRCDTPFEAGGRFGWNHGLFVLAAVVYTVTQFPDVEGVLFKLDGRPEPVPSGKVLAEGANLPIEQILAQKRLRELLDRPVTREDYENALHTVTFSAPMIGSEVASPVRIAGTANVRDGTVTAVLLKLPYLPPGFDAAGSVLAERAATVTCGAGCRGDYEIEIPFEVAERQRGEIELRFTNPDCSSAPRACLGHQIPVTLVP